MINTPPALIGVPAGTLQVWLGQAQQALQSLATGQQVSTVMYSQGEGSRSVTYRRTDIASLNAWIMQLQLALNPGTRQFRRRPLSLRF